MKPAAILVAAFDIEISGPMEAVLFCENGEMARSGIKPNVENVVFFGEFVVATGGTAGFGRKKFSGGAFVPDVRGMSTEKIDNAAEEGNVGERVLAFIAIEDRDWDAPDALARDATNPGERRSYSRCGFRPIRAST